MTRRRRGAAARGRVLWHARGDACSQRGDKADGVRQRGLWRLRSELSAPTHVAPQLSKTDDCDALAIKPQHSRKPWAGDGADERRPCSHNQRTQSQCAGD